MDGKANERHMKTVILRCKAVLASSHHSFDFASMRGRTGHVDLIAARYTIQGEQPPATMSCRYKAL